MKQTDIPMTHEEEAIWKIIEPHWGKGSVEWLMKHLIRFEGRLKLRRRRYLDELNACGVDWGIMILLRTARVQQTSLVEVWNQSYLEFGDELRTSNPPPSGVNEETKKVEELMRKREKDELYESRFSRLYASSPSPMNDKKGDR